MEDTRIDIEYVAALARLELSEERSSGRTSKASSATSPA